MNNILQSRCVTPARNIFYAVVLCSILSWCQEKAEKNIQQNWTQKEYVEGQSYIPATREYIIYSKNITSIVGVKSHLNKATQNVKANNTLSKILNDDDMSPVTLLPKILKESAMDNTRTSKSGAKWYMQMTTRALDEIYRIYPDVAIFNFHITDPVDNIILWALYRKLSHKDLLSFLIKNNINFSIDEIESLMILSYNIWPTRTKALLEKYQPETFEKFISTIVKENNLPNQPTTSYDETYQVTYTNRFGDRESEKEDTREKNKFKEGIRYVYIINALIKQLQEEKQIVTIGTLKISKDNTLYNQVKILREQKVFVQDANINEICNIILESNGYLSTDIPMDQNLFLIKDILQSYLP